MSHDIDNERFPGRRWERSSTCSIPPTYVEPRHQIPRRRRRRVVETQERRKRSGKNGRSRDAISAAADGSDGSEYLLKLRRHESLCMRIVLTLPRARWYDRFYKAVRTVEGTISLVTLCQPLNQHPSDAGPTDANTIMSYRKSWKLSKELNCVKNLSRNKFICMGILILRCNI